VGLGLLVDLLRLSRQVDPKTKTIRLTW